jgi:hypothetical protein
MILWRELNSSGSGLSPVSSSCVRGNETQNAGTVSTT